MGQMLMDGVKAVVLGMGMVYVFLIIMIVLMNAMSKLLAPYANFLVKEQPAKKAKAASSGKVNTLSAQDKILAKAAIEAVKLHRGA